MNKTELMDAILEARADWDAALAGVMATRYEVPGVWGSWTLKDLIAHIAWYEREIATMLELRSYERSSPWWALPDDARNVQIYEANRERALDDVLADEHASFEAVLAQVNRLDDAYLHDSSRFADSPPGIEPWEIVAQNTYEHYEHHARDVRAWLASSG
ncbi:MAG: ClbS/DfsB family four-helix bundle protein [Anaerolineae bacterium]|nr:ClbS/DfsB family four-helix bundle protein [Anaerolineae bacterium]